MTGRVLIIDDEESLRITLSRILQAAGCDTFEAGDGQEALSMIKKCDPDLVFLDIRIPRIDGIQVLREIRVEFPKVPVIMLTGHGSLQSAVESLRLGATDYLQKPIDPEILVARVRVLLDEQRQERRKEELRDQIASLQSELRQLEQDSEPALAIPQATPAAQDRFFKRGRLIADIQARRATFGEEVLNLPPATFDYLIVLAKHSPEVVDYRTLVMEAQDYQVSAGEARELAKWHVYVLRSAIEADPQNPRFLINIRGVGYRLVFD
jgi:DNA-binding response OmpR family regulator